MFGIHCWHLPGSEGSTLKHRRLTRQEIPDHAAWAAAQLPHLPNCDAKRASLPVRRMTLIKAGLVQDWSDSHAWLEPC